MAVKVLKDGTVELRTTIRLVPGRDDELISYFVPFEPLNVAGTIREAMRSGIVKFHRAKVSEENEINLDIGLEL